MERAPCIPPLTPAQMKIAELVAQEFTPKEIAEILKRKATTVEYHIVQMALRIPGTLPRLAKIRIWYQGAPLSLLLGTPASPLKKALTKSRGAGV